MFSYQPIDMHKKKSSVLVVHCSDPRFQDAYRQVIDGIGEYYDLVVFPGASKAITEDQSVIKNIELLYSMHHFETVHILDHINCGAFGDLDDEHKAHEQMLNSAKKILLAKLPQLKVVLHLLGEQSDQGLD